MDVRGIANVITSTVNPNVTVSVKRSTGYGIGPGQKQIPSYAAPVTGPAQIQALDGSELRQVEGLNLQGDIRGIYLRGSLAGVVRPQSKGGDLVTYDGSDWLIVKVLETWPDWTKAVIVRQGLL